jgi:hypothetical protein
MTISVKEAVSKAFEYAHDLYKPQEIPQLMLEEVELDEEKKHWLVTLGYKSYRTIQKQMLPLTTEKESVREYKIFRIDAQDGQFISLKIREV